jgi:hypothetical protein
MGKGTHEERVRAEVRRITSYGKRTHEERVRAEVRRITQSGCMKKKDVCTGE